MVAALSLATAVVSFQTVQAGTATNTVNVNTADLATLETLPGVGATTAQRIIDGRPYSSLTDLEKVKGLSKTKVEAMQNHITLGTTASTTKGKSTKTAASTSSQMSSTTAAAAGPVNVNTADLATLETLPGVGATTAQRIIDGRPYSSLEDLEKVKGLSKTKVEAAQDQITFGSTSAVKAKSTKSTSGKASATAPATETTSGQEPLPATGQSSSGKADSGEMVNINTASAEQLDTLYGIGPTKAQAIIDYRNQHGNFQSPEDIMKVHGIKEGEFDKIKDNITVR